MANRKNTFLIKRSNVAGKVPVAGDLQLGELAINISDVILYASGTTANSILPIGWDRVARTGDTMTGYLYAPSISATTISATTYYNLPTDIFTTGGTYSNITGIATFTNNSGGTFNVAGFSTGGGSVFTGGTVTGPTVFTNGLTATTISATTYYNLPTDVFVTGGTYTSGNAIFTNNTGGTFTVSGFNVGGGGGQVFYLNLSQSQNGNRLLSTTASTASEQTSGVTIANGVTSTIASFQSQPLNITLLPGGVWSFYLHSYKQNNNATFNIFVEVYKRTSGGTETLLFATDPTAVTTNSPNPSMQLSDGYFSGTSLNVSDSVVAVVRATNTSNQSHIITLVTEGSAHYSYVVSTIPTQQGLTCDTLSGCSIIQTIQTDISNKFDKSGGTVTGPTVFTSGLSANTISATTYFNLPTDVRVTGATYSNNTFTYTNNTGGTFSTLFNTMTGLTVTGDLIVSGNTQSWFSGNSASDLVRITQTGSGNALVIEDSTNPDSTPFVVNTSGFVGIGISSPTNPLHISGSTDQIRLSNGSSVWTVASKSNGDFAINSVGTRASMYFGSYGTTNSLRIGPTGAIIVNSSNDSQFTGVGNVIINNGLSANTISATTYYNLPTDIFTTGGTYSSGTTTFTNNTGGTFTVTGFSTSVSPISVVNTSSLFSTGLVSTGLNASGVTHSIFFGRFAGRDATSASNSNFLGNQAGYGATNAYQSIFIGASAGVSAINSNDSNFFGASAGDSVTNANNSNFFGLQAGSAASDANNSNFFGQSAGYQATGADNSNFMGYFAGYGALNAHHSNLLGYQAGSGATNAYRSNFFGYDTGNGAVNAYNSNFIGNFAGRKASDAYNSNFIGQNSGYNASGASYSTLLGYNTGYASLVSNSIGSNNIIIGTNISFSANTANAINIGGVLFGTGTYSATTGNPIISASTGGRIGIGIVNPLATLHVSGDTLIQGNLTVTGNTQSLFSGNSSVELIKIIQNGSGDAFVVQDIANGDASHFVINASGNTAIGLTQPLGTDKLTVSGNTTIYGTLSATTYAGLPNAGVLVVPIATSSVAIGTGSNDYYLNFKIPYNLTISKVDFSVSTAGSDSVRIGIYRGQDLTAVLVGQSAGGTVSTLNSVPIVAESGQNLTFSGGSWIVIGVAVGGTTTNLYGSACPVNNLIAWTNTTDSSGGFPTNPRSKAGTRTSFPSIEITLA